MVIVKEVSAKIINDSRGEKTIETSIKTNVGNFSASSPQGKSKQTTCSSCWLSFSLPSSPLLWLFPLQLPVPIPPQSRLPAPSPPPSTTTELAHTPTPEDTTIRPTPTTAKCPGPCIAMQSDKRLVIMHLNTDYGYARAGKSN